MSAFTPLALGVSHENDAFRWARRPEAVSREAAYGTRALVHSSCLARDLIISIISLGLPEFAGMINASQFSLIFAMVVRRVEAG
jgi:hypothetical protein